MFCTSRKGAAIQPRQTELQLQEGSSRGKAAGGPQRFPHARPRIGRGNMASWGPGLPSEHRASPWNPLVIPGCLPESTFRPFSPEAGSGPKATSRRQLVPAFLSRASRREAGRSTAGTPARPKSAEELLGKLEGRVQLTPSAPRLGLLAPRPTSDTSVSSTLRAGLGQPT